MLLMQFWFCVDILFFFFGALILVPAWDWNVPLLGLRRSQAGTKNYRMSIALEPIRRGFIKKVGLFFEFFEKSDYIVYVNQ